MRELLAQLVLGLATQPRELQVARDAREQLARSERLDQIVVGTRLQALDARFLAGARRQQDDRRVAQRRVRAQSAQQAEAVEARHHHVA